MNKGETPYFFVKNLRNIVEISIFNHIRKLHIKKYMIKFHKKY